MLQKNSTVEVDASYWNEFYRTKTAQSLLVPSQFAAFVLGEVSGIDLVFDIGCGSGRDSLFFAFHGKRVTGVDGALSAIELCRANAQNLGLSNASFFHSGISEPELIEGLNEVRADRPALVYARFFLHAIDEEEEEDFLQMAQSVCEGGFLALEFRTALDAEGQKATERHFRRFVEPDGFIRKAESAGFKNPYFVQGKGYAKYRQDDAHVARLLYDCRKTA